MRKRAKRNTVNWVNFSRRWVFKYSLKLTAYRSLILLPDKGYAWKMTQLTPSSPFLLFLTLFSISSFPNSLLSPILCLSLAGNYEERRSCVTGEETKSVTGSSNRLRLGEILCFLKETHRDDKRRILPEIQGGKKWRYLSRHFLRASYCHAWWNHVPTLRGNFFLS